jgi:hypothetical protein
MIKEWFEEQVKRWLINRGYWIIPAQVPCLVISSGDATYHEDEGGKVYTVYMPKGHKLWALNNSVIAKER